MSIWLTAIILGIVEGLTEFLPVSSTGHLILATELLGYDAAKWAVFNIAIQPGAILAIVVLYWRTFRDMFTGLFRRDPVAFAFVRNLLLAFLPAVVLGLAFGDYIEALLSGQATDPAHYAQRVRASDFGRRFGAAAWPNLSLADLELCADVDRFDFALPVARAGEHLVIR